MDPLSATASVLALIEGTSKSAKYIYCFFRNVVDMPLEVKNYCVSIQALTSTLTEIQTLWCTGNFEPQQTTQFTQLSQSVRECLADVQVAEKRIGRIEKDLKAKKARRTWTKVKYGLIKEGPWLEKFFGRVRMWNNFLTYNLVLLQMKSYTEIKALVEQSNSMLQDIGPLLTQINRQSNEATAERDSRAQSEQHPLPVRVYEVPPKLAEYLQTALEPTYMSGRYFRRINLCTLICYFRRGRIIVQKWNKQGEPSYETLKSGSSCVVELSAQIPWILSRRFSIMAFLTSKMWVRWRSVATFRVSSQRIISKSAEAVLAARTGDIHRMKSLFSNKQASPGDMLSNGYTLTHVAVSSNQFALVELLLREGADLDAVTDYGDTVLHLAVREHVDYNIARILLENGAEVESLNKQFQTPLHSFFNPLSSQLARRYASTMEDISTDLRGMNLAHYFSWTNSSVPEDLQCLPNVRAFLNIRDNDGRTPLHLAAHRGNIAVMKYLLAESPSQDLLDNEGNTSMHHAMRSVRAPDAIKLLLSHNFALDVKNNKGHTPIQHAAGCGTVEALSYLIEYWPTYAVLADGQGHGLLRLAERFGNRKVVVWLITRLGQEGSGPLRHQTQGYPHRASFGSDSRNGISPVSILSGILLGFLLGCLLGSFLVDSRKISKLEPK